MTKKNENKNMTTDIPANSTLIIGITIEKNHITIKIERKTVSLEKFFSEFRWYKYTPNNNIDVRANKNSRFEKALSEQWHAYELRLSHSAFNESGNRF